MNLKPEKKISHFTFSLKAILGKGSFGTVYLGRDSIDRKKFLSFFFRKISSYESNWSLKMWKCCPLIFIFKKRNWNYEKIKASKYCTIAWSLFY